VFTISRFSKVLLTLCNKIVIYGEELLAPHPTLKLEGHPL